MWTLQTGLAHPVSAPPPDLAETSSYRRCLSSLHIERTHPSLTFDSRTQYASAVSLPFKKSATSPPRLRRPLALAAATASPTDAAVARPAAAAAAHSSPSEDPGDLEKMAEFRKRRLASTAPLQLPLPPPLGSLLVARGGGTAAAAAVTAAAAAATADAFDVSAARFVQPLSAIVSRMVSQVEGMLVTVANFPERLTPSQVPPAARSRPARVVRGGLWPESWSGVFCQDRPPGSVSTSGIVW